MRCVRAQHLLLSKPQCRWFEAARACTGDPHLSRRERMGKLVEVLEKGELFTKSHHLLLQILVLLPLRLFRGSDLGRRAEAY